MAIITITSNTKPIDLPSDGYAPCCGQTPEVITWNKGIGKGCIGVLCRNPQCENHVGVLAADVDIKQKWEQFRKEVGMDQQPSIGRVVHYVLPDGRYPGEHRPAFIVKVWSETHVNLQVFVDGTNDYTDYNGSVWVTSVAFDPSGEQPRSWHWPERV
jgi:hypothetical protein